MAVAPTRARRLSDLRFLNRGDEDLTTEKGVTMNLLHDFVRKDEGQDLVEYALLASFISIVAVVTIRAIGPLVRVMYQNVQAAIT